MHKYAVIELYTDSGPIFYVTPGAVELRAHERRIYSANSLRACVDRRDEEEDTARQSKESPGTDKQQPQERHYPKVKLKFDPKLHCEKCLQFKSLCQCKG